MIYKILFFIGLVLFLYVVWEVIRFRMLIAKGAEVSNQAVRYERIYENPTSEILIMGDSTAVGTGSHDSKNSVAGRIGAAYPESSVINMGQNGLKTAPLLAQLQKLEIEKQYSLILLQIGGNDILQFSNLSQLKKDITAVLVEAKKHSNTVVLMTSGNVGAAPAFSPLVSRIYQWQTLKVRDLFMKESNAAGVSYIDLYKKRSVDPFVKEPKRFHGDDGLHPSGEGYGLWFDELATVLARALVKQSL